MKMDETQYSPTEIALRVALETALERMNDDSVCELRNQLRKYSDALRQNEDSSVEAGSVAASG
jgi:hypothetical protein